MDLWNKIARQGKRAFIGIHAERLIEPVNPLLLRISFLSMLARWRRQHRDLPFREDPGSTDRRNQRYLLYQFVLDSEKLAGPIHYLEFGVWVGNSFKWWVEHNQDPDSTFVGFDTFTGLPEQFGMYGEGAFSTEGKVPDIPDPRCRFEKGLFQDTLPGFLGGFQPGHRKVIHLDADLYTSTLFVLTRLAPILESGDILIFDEFGVPTHEFRAFTDFVESYQVDYDVLGAVNDYLRVAIRLR